MLETTAATLFFLLLRMKQPWNESLAVIGKELPVINLQQIWFVIKPKS